MKMLGLDSTSLSSSSSSSSMVSAVGSGGRIQCVDLLLLRLEDLLEDALAGFL
jgi:hypothetical protein